MSVVYANCTTSIGAPNGSIQDLVKGEPWDGDDPLVKARPEFFSDSPLLVRTSGSYKVVEVVEQATAAPGEKRRGR